MPEWFEKLGFDYNPFSRTSTLYGYDDVLKEIFYSIMAGNIIFVEGESGCGKTSLLREAITRFGGKKKIIYFNCNSQKEPDIETLLKGRYGFFGLLLNIKPRNMILLLDEVELLSERSIEQIKYYYDHNYLRSVIFTGKSFEKSKLNASIRHRIHKVLTLQPLSDLNAIKAVREKIGERFFTDRQLRTIYHNSGRNIGKFLKNVENLLAYMAENNLKEIDEDAIKRVIQQ